MLMFVCLANGNYSCLPTRDPKMSKRIQTVVTFEKAEACLPCAYILHERYFESIHTLVALMIEKLFEML